MICSKSATLGDSLIFLNQVGIYGVSPVHLFLGQMAPFKTARAYWRDCAKFCLSVVYA